MADLAELERVLAAEWNRDNLAVYGDYLQSIGDPRGELIAIDLAGRSAERAARKRDLAVEWLGDDLATIVLHVGAIDHGFVQLGHRAPTMGGFAMFELLAGPAGRYLRELTIEDSRMLDVYDRLAEAPRPWLARMSVPHPRTVLERDALERAVTRLPLLRELELTDAGSLPQPLQVSIPPHVRMSYSTS